MMSLNKVYENIFDMALISLVIAIVIKVSGFNPLFEITILEYTIQSSYHTLWLLIGIYFFYLALPYFLISNSNLKSNYILSITHYLIVVLFFVAILNFSCIDLNFFKNVISEFNLSDLDKIVIYIYTLFIALILFALNIVAFIFNLFFLTIKNRIKSV
jgi:hypothetical protein